MPEDASPSKLLFNLIPTAQIFTIHGFAHITNVSNHLVYRLVWLFVFLFLVIMGTYWSILTYLHWSSHLTLTAVKSTGLPISQVEFPAITVCGQGTLTLEPALKQQLSDYMAKNQNVGGNMEDIKKMMMHELYPGLADTANLDAIVRLLLADDPDKFIKSLVLTGGGFDPCTFGPVDKCPKDWQLVMGEESCFQNLGNGTFMADPCPAMGAHLTRIANRSDIFTLKTILGYGIDNNFWLDAYHNQTDDQFQFYGPAGLTLSDLIQLSGVKMVEASNLSDANCLKATFDHKEDVLYIIRTGCEDRTVAYICHKNVNKKCTNTTSNRSVDPDEMFEAATDLVFNPLVSKDLTASIAQAKENLMENYATMNKSGSYDALFNLLWHSQLTCYNSEENPFPAMIRECAWRNVPVPCSAIFNTTPTDRGICCSFNIQAIKMLEDSNFRKEILKQQSKDFSGLDMDEKKASGDWLLQTDKTPRTGRDNGLSFTLDGHFHMLPASSVNENFGGFTAIIDAPNQFPLTETKRKISIMPGHENLISLTAFKVTTDQSVLHLVPEDRQCYFEDEYELAAHRHYTRSNCLLECTLSRTLANMENKCLPWYYPPLVGTAAKICDPWEAVLFRQGFDNVSIDSECPHCLAECVETQYSASLSAAPFRQPCDMTNIGRTTFCDLNLKTDRDLAIWGKKVLNRNKYYLPKSVREDLEMTLTNDHDYNPYMKDIAQVYLFFESPTILEYSRETRLTLLELVGQIGGLMGLCVGISLVSTIEVTYWLFYNMLRGLFKFSSTITEQIITRCKDRVCAFVNK